MRFSFLYDHELAGSSYNLLAFVTLLYEFTFESVDYYNFIHRCSFIRSNVFLSTKLANLSSGNN